MPGLPDYGKCPVCDDKVEYVIRQEPIQGKYYVGRDYTSLTIVCPKNCVPEPLVLTSTILAQFISVWRALIADEEADLQTLNNWKVIRSIIRKVPDTVL